MAGPSYSARRPSGIPSHSPSSPSSPSSSSSPSSPPYLPYTPRRATTRTARTGTGTGVVTGTTAAHHSSPSNHSRSRATRSFPSIPHFLSTLLFLTLLSYPASSASAPSPTTLPRQGHTATLIQNTVYFVGGLGTASPNDTSPVKSISAFDLKNLVFTETPTTLGIYKHSATANRTYAATVAASSSTPGTNSVKIGLTFGVTSPGAAPADALLWLDPTTGAVTSAGNNITPLTGGSSGGGVLVGRIGQTLVQLNSMLWVTGGRSMTPTSGPALGAQAYVADTPTFDLSANTWSNRIKGLARFGHASAPAGLDKIVSCYGSSIAALLPAPQTLTALDTADCVYYSIASATFSPATLVWTNPADGIVGGRTGHSLVPAVPVDTSQMIYMFGGMDSEGQVYQDVYQMDVSKLPTITVTKVTQPASAPVAGPVTAPASVSGKPLNTTTTSTGAAETLPTGVVPSARAQHAAVAVGSQIGYMIIHGGISSTSKMANDSGPFFFSMKNNTWIDKATFGVLYPNQTVPPVSYVSVAVIIAGIMAGVLVLGGCVAFYIWKGLRDDELEKVRKEEAEAAAIVLAATLAEAGSPTFATMDEYYLDRRDRKVAALGMGTERKVHAVYPLFTEEEENLSMATGPFKSTSSLLQDEDFRKRSAKKQQQHGSEAYHSSRSKPWTRNNNNEPYSPGGTTLTENGSLNGYFSSSASSSAPSSRLNKNNSNGSSSQRSNRQDNGNGNNNATTESGGGGGISGGPLARDSYYNTRDMYLDETDQDDVSSITVSLASESTMSPWAATGTPSHTYGHGRMQSMDLAPPNPRFSRGAISQAHRQLVGTIPTNHHQHQRNDSGGWDTSSPGGSQSDGEHHRRSVNSMQWVSFDPSELTGRPESGIYSDPLSQRSLTVRNASLYGNPRASVLQPSSNMNNNNTNNNNNNNPRMSMFGGSNTSDTNTDDSSSYYYSGPGGKRISTALAARQQRRSMRNSQDSQLSSSGATAAGAGVNEDLLVARVLPSVTTKVTKPTMAKVAPSHRRGSRTMVVPSAGPLGDRVHHSGGGEGALFEEEEAEIGGIGGLGIDFSGFNVSGDGYGGSGRTGNNRSSFQNAAAYQTRRGSSTLNPNNKREGSKHQQHSQQQQQREDAAPNVVLRMPPGPKHGGGNNSSKNKNGGQLQQPTPTTTGLRDSIMELGQDMPGFLSYGDNNL